MPDSTSTRMSAGQSATHRRTSTIDCAANRMNVLINSRLRSFRRPPIWDRYRFVDPVMALVLGFSMENLVIQPRT
jgi:hypothetical protein